MPPREERPPPLERDPAYADRNRRPNSLLIASLLIGLLLIGGLVALAMTTDDDNNNPTAEPSASLESPSSEETKKESKQETTPPETTTAESSPEESSPPDSGGAPAGFTTYTDQTGFSVAVPEGWQAGPSDRSPTAVDVMDPSGTRFLRIDQTDTPKDDPKKDWEQQEKSVAARLDNYQRISIEEVDYNGWPAADWEFTWGSGTHVINRGFVPNESKGYALYMSSTESQWAESLQIFQVAADTFQPAGGSGED